MESLENDLLKVASIDDLNKIISDAVYYKSDLREYHIGNAIRKKYNELAVYEGVVVSFGYDSDLDSYYVLFWNDGRLTECIVRNEFDYYALESALRKVDLKYPVVLSSDGVLKQDNLEIKFNEELNAKIKAGVF